MYTLINGNLHRIKGDAVRYVYCPFINKQHPSDSPDRSAYDTVCGTWCALFEEKKALNRNNKLTVRLHCSSAEYEISQDNSPKSKQEGN